MLRSLRIVLVSSLLMALSTCAIFAEDFLPVKTRMDTAISNVTTQPSAVIEDLDENSPEFGTRPWEAAAKETTAMQENNIAKRCEKLQEEQDEIDRIAEEEAEKKQRMEDSLVNYEVPMDIGNFKSWMSYTAVTATGSAQYAILNSEEAYTDENNFRKIGDAYFVALGSYYSDVIGTKFRITLSDGTKFNAVLGDQKSDRHTDKTHRYHTVDHSVVEFIMGSNDSGNGNAIHTYFPAQTEKIQKYTVED